VGAILKSPFVGSKGWSKNAITTSMTWAAHHKNLDVKYGKSAVHHYEVTVVPSSLFSTSDITQ